MVEGSSSIDAKASVGRRLQEDESHVLQYKAVATEEFLLIDRRIAARTRTPCGTAFAVGQTADGDE